MQYLFSFQGPGHFLLFRVYVWTSRILNAGCRTRAEDKQRPNNAPGRTRQSGGGTPLVFFPPTSKAYHLECAMPRARSMLAQIILSSSRRAIISRCHCHNWLARLSSWTLIRTQWGIVFWALLRQNTGANCITTLHLITENCVSEMSTLQQPRGFLQLRLTSFEIFYKSTRKGKK